MDKDPDHHAPKETDMTRTQITAAIQCTDDAATAKLLEEITSGNTDAILDLVNKIFQAGRHDATTDVIADLKSDGQHEAADFIKVNYL